MTQRNLVWLGLLTLWSDLKVIALEQPPLGFTYASYEVTIPRKVTYRLWEPEPEFLTYLLQVEGKGKILRLRQKRGLVPKHFPVFTYNKQGNIQLDYPYVRDDCYYRGFVQDSPSSWVTLSTCLGGLWGVLQLENKTYEIEPVQASPTFQHIVFRLEEKEDAVRMTCGLTKEELKRQKAMINTKGDITAKTFELDWWTHTRYADIVIIVEHQRYISFGRNETLIILRVLDILHISNTLYEPLDIILILIGLEMWTERNFIEINPDIDPTLTEFGKWRANTLVGRIPNDAGILLANKVFLRARLGLAYTGVICSPRWSAAVVSYTVQIVAHVAITLTHEFGHIIGMQHDEGYCKCRRKHCIMAAYFANTDKFSNCSYRDYYKFKDYDCMLVPKRPDKVFVFKHCGNKVVEGKEECDCGSKTQCESDPCCQANCKLRSGARCAFGDCCANCQYISAGTVCREKKGICDLTEYCTGTSEWCPRDVHIQDGAPCQDGVYCYHGNCTTHNGQCRMIFGDKATAAPGACYNTMNMQGDRFGHCVLNYGMYRRCTVLNALCGRIHCANVEELPSLEEHTTIIHTRNEEGECWGTDYHSGMGIPDIGKVRDGVPCGHNMMCIASECTNVSNLNYDCNVTKCHNRGVCNTLKHCHCDAGWSPPNCLHEGNGGSIDSGPPPRQNTTHQDLPKQRRSAFIVGLITVLGIFLSTIACIGLFTRLYPILASRRTNNDPNPGVENPQVTNVT